MIHLTSQELRVFYTFAFELRYPMLLLQLQSSLQRDPLRITTKLIQSAQSTIKICMKMIRKVNVKWFYNNCINHYKDVLKLFYLE